MFWLTLIYFITRLPFLRPSPVFYDSFEYLEIAKKLDTGNFFQIIRASHQPIHTSYFLTIFIFKKLMFFVSENFVLVLISLLFGYFAVIIWYFFVKKFINEEKAFFSSLLILLFPYFFVVNTNILYEAELLFFQIVSIYFCFLSFKKKNLLFVILSGLFWGISQSIFIGSLLIFPAFLYFFLGFKKKKILFFLSFFLTGILTLIILDFIFLGPSFYLKYFSHLFDFVSIKDGFGIFLLRIVRNIFVESAAILSVSGLLFFIFSLLIIFFRKKQDFIFYLFFILPAIIFFQYWHAGLFGRLGIFIIFPSALAISQIFQKSGIKIVVLILIGLTTFYCASKQRQISPMDRYFSLIKNINFKKNALITSDYNKFVYLKQGISFLFIFNGLDENVTQARKFILKNLNEKKRVFIDSSGLRFPYYQFDGSFYHPLSLGKIGQSQAKEVLKDFDFQVYKSDPINPEVYFFEIKKANIKKRIIKPRLIYPSCNNWYKINLNKYYFLDPFVNLFYFLFRKKDPDFWWYELRTN